MDVVTNSFALAVLLAWATPFQAGLDAMQRKDFARAETELTNVLKVKPLPADILLAAHCQRAQARVGLGRKEAAREDFRTVVASGREHPLRAEALRGFREAGGEAKGLWPTNAPPETWKKFVEAGQQEGSLAGLRSYLSDDLWRMLNLMETSLRLTGEEFAKEVLGELAQLDVGEVDMDDQRAVARMTLVRNDTRITLEMLPAGDGWVVNRLLGIAANDREGVIMDLAGQAQPVIMVNGRIVNIDQQIAIGGGKVQASVVVRRGEAAKARVEKKDVPPEQQAEIRKLIAQLAAAAPAERAAARARLKSFGEAARPFLREEMDNADPEIATTVRELLGE